MNPEATPTRRKSISLEHQPIEVSSYFASKRNSSDYPEWFLFATDSSGTSDSLYIENNGSHLCAYTTTYELPQIHHKTLFSHWFEITQTPGFRHCAIQDTLGEMIHFPSQLLLTWALLDLDVDATANALSKGADLFRPVLSEYYAMDLLSLAVAMRSQHALRFYQADERDYEARWSFEEIDSTDYPVRAARIREILSEAGAQDFAPFRNALKNGNFDLAKSHLLKEIPLDAQAPDGLTPLLAAIFRKDLACLRWLIHQGADCSVHANIQDWLGIEPPESFSAMWNNRSNISAHAAACAANSPEAFHILLNEAAYHFSNEDYQEIMKHKDAPEWAKNALLTGGYTTLPEPIQLSARDTRMMEYFAKLDRKSPSDFEQKNPVPFRTRFLNYITNGHTITDWADQHAPELLNPPAGDPVAIERLVQSWLKATGADPSPFLLQAVESNDLSLVELLLPADPTIMGEALITAMTHANTLTYECYDFCLYRGCITDDIRGKGVPASYLEIANSIATLLRDHGARDFTRLAKAAREGDLEKMREEVKDGTPINFTCDGWGSPLLAAIVGGNLAAVEYLLNSGADPNLEFDPSILDGGSGDYLHLPIVAAVRYDKTEILKALIQAGADLQSPQMKRTRIFENGSLSRETAKMLFKSPLPLLRDIDGNTCAHLLNEESLRLYQDLIHSSSWNARNNAGHTPLIIHIANESALIPFLLSAGASPNEYTTPCSSCAFDRVVFDTDIIAHTPIHAAIDSGDVILLENLLAAGGTLELPAFRINPNPTIESCQRLRDILNEFQPVDLPLWKRDFWLTSLEESREEYRIFEDLDSSPSPWSPSLSSSEITLLSHYLAEDPSRAAQHPDFIIPITCLELELRKSSILESYKARIEEE